jgi:phosphomannomutase / phosphoglucomutase
MNASEHIFRQYDIRGIVGTDLDSDIARGVGRAYASQLAASAREQGGGQSRLRVVVGKDNRPSSVPLADALIEGLLASGADVLDLGVVPTPVVWWAEKMNEVHGAVQVTGSHNPAEWNGIKMTMFGRSLWGDAIQGIRRRVLDEDWIGGDGQRVAHPVLDAYVEDLFPRFHLARPVRVVVDCGNGTGSVVAERLLLGVGAEVVPLYCESDGTFPNHHPDPTVDENLEDLVHRVRAEGAELGIAFDGDADRIGAVDARGNIIRGDVLLLLFGLDLLEREGPDQLLIFDVKCSQLLPEAFEQAGGRSLMWMTGHSLIKEKMRETGAPLAGELSGHICFGADEYIGVDDALYAACRLVEIVSRNRVPLHERIAAFPHYLATPEIRVEVSEEEKAGIVEKAVAHFSREHEVVQVDGARILFGDGWGLIRASNTQPVLVARFEARTEERLEAIRSEVEGWLREQGVDV